jgi:cytochrome c biogenesis protein ResB
MTEKRSPRYAWQRHPAFCVLASTPLGVGLIVAVAVVLIWGTIVGARTGLSTALHAIYGAVWFQALLALLVVSLVCCVLKVMPFRWSQLGFIITHLSLLLVYAGAMLTIHFGAQGVVRVVEGAATDSYFDPAFVSCSDPARGQSVDLPTGFEKDAERLRERYTGEVRVQAALDEVTVIIDRYHPDATPHAERAIRMRLEDGDGNATSARVHAYDRVDVELGGRTLTIEYPKRVPLGFSLRLDEFVARRYPHSSIPAAYESHMLVEGPGGATKREVIAMNAPATIGGYVLYQSSFGTDRETGRPYTVLALSRDPGAPVLYAGFGALLVGLIVSFYVRPVLRRREQRKREVPT